MDTYFEYMQESQTLIGQRKRMLRDCDTGEIIAVDQITKRVYGTKMFWKVYLADFLAVLGIFDSKQLDVFIYVAENTSPSDNIFIGTYDKIGKATGASRQTISRIMKKLQDHAFIVKVQQGVWRVNPNVLMKGNDTKRQMLLTYYEDDKANAIQVTRGPRKAIPETHIPTQEAIEDSETGTD